MRGDSALQGPAATPWPSEVAASRWPDRPAVECDGATLTWAELESQVARYAERLQTGGLAPGEAVGVLGPNSPEWIVQALAIPRAGGVLLPLNTRLAEPEIAHQIAAARAVRLPGAHTVLFTSGTTGRPKGAVLTWANHAASARACIAHLGLSRLDRYLACIPFFHIGGLNIVYRMALVGGCSVVHGRFDPAAVVRSMREKGVTRVSLTAAMLRRVLDEAGPPGIPDSVRTVLAGGESADPALLRRCPQARATYGLTEACSHVTIADPGDFQTAGAALPGYEVRIVAEDGSVLPEGVPGLIAVRGEATMAGYLGEEPRLAESWLATGDFGHLDAQGRLTVHARRDDLIVSGGENVYPAEVEAVLNRHPAVRECAVVGVPDVRWGQAPAAIVVRDRDGEAVEQAALEAYLRGHLGGFKIPRRWLFVAALPRTASGKVDRAALRSLAGARLVP